MNASNQVDKATGYLAAIPESEIPSLPAWQRELLSDPGWNQPYISPRQATPVEAPQISSLLAETKAAFAKGVELNPRYTSAAKGASWFGDSSGPFGETISKGEYEDLDRDAVPPFGCNSNGTNESPAGNAIEDLILETASGNVLPTYCLSYVREGLCTANWFNTLAGANKNASAAVYQAYCSQNAGGFDPQNPPADAQVAEISYRSSLVPDGAPGGTCAATAYVVRDYYWRAFNNSLDAIPDGPVDLYNVLIAPSGPVSADQVSTGDTTGAYQPFYFGSMSACYGGAWIVGLTASDSDCETFAQWFDESSGNYVADRSFWYRPVYGVILQRWMDLSPVVNQPWQSELGWPVYGPVAYDDGEMQLNENGSYYQWGMWFERGFIWWVDYDQTTSPTVPDEAQAFRYTGSNVYCASSTDAFAMTSIPCYYGGSGPLGVTVSVDSYRNSFGDDWEPVELDRAKMEYHVALPAGDGLATVQLKMSARGYGGTPNADCRYKSYVWAFRDGTIQAAGVDYSTDQMRAIHVYGDLTINKESIYIVRVQVQDETGFAYGDSLPIVLGHGGIPAAGVMVIRDDAPDFNTYNTNFNALLSDLDQLEIQYNVFNFSPDVISYFNDGNYGLVIWYRGGPGVDTEPVYITDWTAEEETAFNALLSHNLFLISQEHGSVNSVWMWSYWGWDNDPDSQFCERINYSPMTHATCQNMGLTSNEDNGIFSWLYGMFGAEMGKGKVDTLGPQRLGLPGVWGNQAAELNLLNGSSGKLPIRLTWGAGGTDVLQFCTRAWYPPFGPQWVNPGWKNGMQANPDGSGDYLDGCYGAACLSYGNSSAGGATWNTPGPGKFWCWGMPYAKLEVTQSAPPGMTRAEVLQNVLSWMNSVDYSAHYDWEAYTDTPEIVAVTPGYWTTSPQSFVRGATSVPGMHYPDTTGSDAFRTDYANGAGERYISTGQAGNDGVNTNDIDFQFPWYAYITTTNGTVETSPEDTPVPPALDTDDTFAVRGLLLSDADLNWTRYTPPTGELPNCLLNQGAPVPAVAGYFISVAGNTGDEVYSSYGTSNPALTWNNSYHLEVEVIAHWPESLLYGSNQARLYWSMYPGHWMMVPGTNTLLNDTVDGWYKFRKVFDIDPDAWPSGRTTSSWNAASFAFTSVIAEGRVVEFDYRSINHWNPDLNFDLDSNTIADGPADKFPVRCRLFTDYTTYTDSDPGVDGIQPYIWPNNQPPLSSYVEGGCYVVDNGDPAGFTP